MDWKLGGLIFLLLPVSALAQEAPNVKGITLGMSESAVISTNPKAECGDDSTPGTRRCVIRGGYGPDPAGLAMSFLQDDQVYLVLATFDHAVYSTVASGMQQKFGAPLATKNEELTTRMGVTYPSTVTLWKAGNGVLTLKERDGRIDRSGVRLADADALKQANERRKSDPKNAENL